MSTTDQRPRLAPEALAGSAGTGAGAGAWTVPGVDHVPSQADATSAHVPSQPDAASAHVPSQPDAASAHVPSQPDAAPAPDACDGSGRTSEGPGREAPETSTDAAARWREDLHTASHGPGFGVGHVHPVIAALAACVEALDGIRDAGVGTLTAREIRTLLLAVAQVISTAVALKLRLLVAGEAQRLADLTGATSTAAILAHLTHVDRPDAGSEMKLAKDLHTRYPLLADALAAGAVNLPQLRACVAALRKLPKDLPNGKLEDCQRFLLDAAATMAPRQLKILGRRLWEVIDPDGADAKDGKDLQDEEERARAKAWFTSWRNGDGTTGFRGKLPDAQADMLLKMLHAYASPRRRSNPNIPTSQPDDISRPDSGDISRGDAGDSHPEPDCDGSPRDGCLDDEAPEERETGKAIPYPVRLGHALMDLVERIPRDAIPSSGGIAATIVITAHLDQLRSGLGTATLDTGTVISATQVRRLACEAGLMPMVLGGASQPLDVGRKARLHNEAQRTAMSVRQGGVCAIDGCDRPTAWCEGHHLTPWAEDGETSVEDGILVCPYHHHLAHHTDWQLSHDDGRWCFKRNSR